MTFTPDSGGYGAPQPNPNQPNPYQANPYQPQQQYQQYQQPQQHPFQPFQQQPVRSRGLGSMLTIGVAGLGVVNFLLGFAPFAKEDPKTTSSGIFGSDSMNFFDNASLGAGIVGIALLLLAGVIAGLGLLPNQVPNNIVVAAASITGIVTLLFTLIGLSEGLEVGVGLIFVIVFGFIQAACAVAVLVLGSAALTPSAPVMNYNAPPPGFGQ